MKNLLLFVPHLVLLCGRLMVDPRVPAKSAYLLPVLSSMPWFRLI